MVYRGWFLNECRDFCYKLFNVRLLLMQVQIFLAFPYFMKNENLRIFYAVVQVILQTGFFFS
jgi:hypothetical protein